MAASKTKGSTKQTPSKPDKSNAEAARDNAKQAVAKGDLPERENYTAKQVATRCGTDAKTMRKFFRSSSSTVEPVGQGGRYEFDADDLPTIKEEFERWIKGSKAGPAAGKGPKSQGKAKKTAAAPAVVIEEDDDEDVDSLFEEDGPADEELDDEGADEDTDDDLEELDFDDENE